MIMVKLRGVMLTDDCLSAAEDMRLSLVTSASKFLQGLANSCCRFKILLPGDTIQVIVIARFTLIQDPFSIWGKFRYLFPIW
jgi:hypothetical protein